MKTRISTAIMFGLLAFLLGVIFASGLLAQEAKSDTSKVTDGALSATEIVLAEQHIPLPADMVEILKLESRIKINRLAEEFLMIRQARAKCQIQLDSLNAKINRLLLEADK